jgi:hypothetical protein
VQLVGVALKFLGPVLKQEQHLLRQILLLRSQVLELLPLVAVVLLELPVTLEALLLVSAAVATAPVDLQVASFSASGYSTLI